MIWEIETWELGDIPKNFEADAVWGFEAFDKGLASWPCHLVRGVVRVGAEESWVGDFFGALGVTCVVGRDLKRFGLPERHYKGVFSLRLNIVIQLNIVVLFYFNFFFPPISFLCCNK